MITLYSGTPGSGKSLHLAQTLYDRIKLDRCIVISNFALNLDAIRGRKKGIYLVCENYRMTPRRLIRFSNTYRRVRNHGRPIKEGQFTLVIDECQIMFNARDWQMQGRNEWLSFFTQHRKYGFDIILVSQFDRMIDRQVRALIEYEEIHRKVNNYGLFGKILGLLSGGSLFAVVKMWYPMKQKLGFSMFIMRKKYYKLYDTYKQFDAARVDGKGV